MDLQLGGKHHMAHDTKRETFNWRDQLNEIHPKLLAAVLEATIERRYAKNEELCREGDSPDGMYLVESGRILVEALTVDGGAIGLSTVDSGGIVGEQALLTSKPRSATLIAVRDTQVRLLRPRQFRELRIERPEIDRLMVLVLDDRLREMSMRLAEAVHSSARDRVLRRLDALSTAFDGSIFMSQIRLASLAGTTRPTVNRVLQELVEDGIISLKRAKVTVIDKERLQAEVPRL